MTPIIREAVSMASGSFDLQVLATGHHFIAQALKVTSALLESRLSKPACQEGLPLGKLQGDPTLIAQELARALRELLVFVAAT